MTSRPPSSRKTPKARRPSASWVVAVIIAIGFAGTLGVSGIGAPRSGNDAANTHTAVGTDNVPESVRDGGPWIDAAHGPVTSRYPAPRTIALTFDDGPDPVWTPQILAVLRRHAVPATFFVVGSNVSRYPELVRQIHDGGSELGVHTFSHVDLVEVADWRLRRELDETQLAIAGSAGVTTNLLRPPYSSTAGAIDDLGYGTVTAAGALGYVTVFTTQDSEDWQRPGVDAIIRNATPPADATTGAVVLMHDAGGDRSETVAALDGYITRMQGLGYRFTTVTGAFGTPDANPPASQENRSTGGVLLTALAIATGIVGALRWLLLVVGVLVVLRMVLMVVAARRNARRRRAPSFRWGDPVTRPVSVIVPAYNESANIEATVRSLVASDHPVEIIVVDDGSTDGTADIVEALCLPEVRVLRQVNAGKSVALNTGVRAAAHDLVIMIDGDTIFEPETVRLLVQPFADPAVGAVAGNVKIANRDTLIGRLQHVEYVIGFNIDRRVQDAWGSIATIPGAAGAFRRRALMEVGGLSTDTLAEDTDLTIALGRAGWTVVFEDRALAWTEAPATLQQLWRQRFRWSYGTMQAIWKHRRAVRERGPAGRLGRRGLAHVAAFHILLPLTAPLVDVFMVYGLLFQDPATTLLLWLAMLLVQLAGALVAFRLEREPTGPLWVLPVQQLLYRQLMYLVLVHSIRSALTGGRVRWQRMHRVGVLGQLLPAVTVAPTGTPAGRARPRRPVTPPAPAPRAPVDRDHRERWPDVLRAAASIAVVAYDVSDESLVSLIPAAGVVFALGGSFFVASLRRAPAVDVVGHRLRRLLPPLWLMGVVVVPIMIWQGPAAPGADDVSARWAELVFWFLPILDPPSTAATAVATGGLWFVRTALWLVLLSPLLLAAWRRRPALAVVAPLTVVALDAVLGLDMANSGSFGSVLLDLCVFAPCWMIGFAHRDGALRRRHPLVPAGLAVASLGLGGWWTWAHPAAGSGYDLSEIPLGQALVSAGAVLVLLRIGPRLAWLDRVPGATRLLAVLNARALTIYLAHPAAFACAPLVGAALGWSSTGARLGTGLGLTAVAMVALGWVEDIGARRPPRLLPGGRSRPAGPEPVPPGRTAVRPEPAGHAMVGPAPPRRAAGADRSRRAPVPPTTAVPVPAGRTPVARDAESTAPIGIPAARRWPAPATGSRMPAGPSLRAGRHESVPAPRRSSPAPDSATAPIAAPTIRLPRVSAQAGRHAVRDTAAGGER